MGCLGVVSPFTDGCVVLQSRVHFMVQAELQLSKQSASEGKSACVGLYREQGNLQLTDRISHYNYSALSYL